MDLQDSLFVSKTDPFKNYDKAREYLSGRNFKSPLPMITQNAMGNRNLRSEVQTKKNSVMNSEQNSQLNKPKGNLNLKVVVENNKMRQKDLSSISGKTPLPLATLVNVKNDMERSKISQNKFNFLMRFSFNDDENIITTYVKKEQKKRKVADPFFTQYATNPE
jgi:hypothetical protein